MSESRLADFSKITSPLSNIRITLSPHRATPYGFLFEYQDGTKNKDLDWVSGTLTTQEDFSLGDSESIVLVFLYSHEANTVGIQFMTDVSRMSKVFGHAEGQIHLIHAMSHDGACPFVGLKRITWNRDGSNALALGLNCDWSPKKIGARFFAASSYASGWIGRQAYGGGKAFNMLSTIGDPTNARLSSIKIWNGSYIDAIQITYIDGSQSDKLGGGGGEADTFTLTDGEYITRIEARHDLNADSNSHPQLRGLTFVTNRRASKHYGSYGNHAATYRAPENAAVPMSLLTFAGSAKQYVFALLPIWAAADPVSCILTIDDVITSSPLQKRPFSVDAYEGTVVNKSNSVVKKTLQMKYSNTKSTTVTVSNWWSAKGSVKFTLKWSAKGKAEIPGLGGAELGVEAGLEAALEASGGQTFTNGETKSSTEEKTITVEVTVSPGEAVRGSATWAQYTAEDVVWRGTMTSTYADGSKKSVPVSGVMSGTHTSKAEARYERMSID